MTPVSRRHRSGFRSWITSCACAAILVAIGVVLPVAMLVVTPVLIGIVAKRRMPLPDALAVALVVPTAIWLAAMAIGGQFPELGVLTPVGAGVTLALPAIVAAVVAGMAPRQFVEAAGGVRGWGSREKIGVMLAVASGPFAIAVVTMLSWSRFGLASAAWTMSGDARNHLLLARQIVESGGIDRRLFSWYPALPNSVLSLTLNPVSIRGSTPSRMFAHDIAMLEAVTVLAIVATCLLFAALTWMLLEDRPRGRASVVAASSLIPLSGLVIGVALRDGYFSALVTIPMLAAAILLVTRAAQGPRFRRTAVLGALASVPVLAACWTVVAPPVVVALIPVAGLLLRTSNRSDRRLYGAVAGGAGILTLWVVFPLIHAGTAGDYVARSGSIMPPSPEVFLAVAVFATIAAFSARDSRLSLRVPPYAIASIVVIAMVIVAVKQQPDALLWGYYPSKLAWIWIAVSLPLGLALAGMAISGNERSEGFFSASRGLQSVSTVAMRGAIAALVVVGIWFGVRAVSPVPSPLLEANLTGFLVTSPIAQGWNQPNAGTVQAVLDLSHVDGQHVLWNHADPGNDRLGNFWLDVLDPPIAPQSTWPVSPFGNWAYFESPGDTASLCELLGLQPYRIVFPDPRFAAACAVDRK